MSDSVISTANRKSVIANIEKAVAEIKQWSDDGPSMRVILLTAQGYLGQAKAWQHDTNCEQMTHVITYRQKAEALHVITYRQKAEALLDLAINHHRHMGGWTGMPVEHRTAEAQVQWLLEQHGGKQ